MSFPTSPVAILWETISAAVPSVSGIAQSKDWALWREQLMVPVTNYLWLFPDAVKSGKVLMAAQRGERLFPSSHHLLYGVWVALGLCILRAVLDRLVFGPLGIYAMKLKHLAAVAPAATDAASSSSSSSSSSISTSTSSPYSSPSSSPFSSASSRRSSSSNYHLNDRSRAPRAVEALEAAFALSPFPPSPSSPEMTALCLALDHEEGGRTKGVKEEGKDHVFPEASLPSTPPTLPRIGGGGEEEGMRRRRLCLTLTTPSSSFPSYAVSSPPKSPSLSFNENGGREGGQVVLDRPGSIARVHAYFRWRRQEGRENKRLAKFKEACWRSCVYLTAVGLSWVCVVPQLWFWDIRECWYGYPLQAVPSPVVFYYAYQLGNYLHLSLFQFTDTKRSDFWEMFLHHAATLFLIAFSWLSCFIRIGTLVMIVHDLSDVFLETAKIFNYTSRSRPWAQVVTDSLFVCFAVSFFLTRLVIYPFWILHSTFTHAHAIIGGKYLGMYIFYGMLFVLQFLHVFWFYLIARMAVNMIVKGKVEKDVRSDDDEEEEEEEEEGDGKVNGRGGRNGKTGKGGEEEGGKGKEEGGEEEGQQQQKEDYMNRTQ